MIGNRKQSNPSSSLLDLPDAALYTIVTCLAEYDKQSLMSACRKAFHMTMLTAEITLIVTEATKFSGINQVLDMFPTKLQLEIMCPANQQGTPLPAFQQPLSALAVLMGLMPSSYLQHDALNCRWEYVTKIYIQSTMMRCLVPPFIATACPHLTHLAIMHPYCSEPPSDGVVTTVENLFTSSPADALPLTKCSSLKHLGLHAHIQCFNDHEFQLPPAYHSTSELHLNLPKVDTLVMKGSNLALIEAFATQLTHLEVHGWPPPYTVQQAIRQCSSLQHLEIALCCLPDNPASLKELSWFMCTDRFIKPLLGLPSLKTLHLEQMSIQDWSGHACFWQELYLGQLPQFTDFANLNLSSLKVLDTYGDQSISLPDPSKPESLAAVQRAADILAHVEQIVLNPSKAAAQVFFGQCGTISWFITEPDTDTQHDGEAVSAFERIEQTAAKMVTIAAQRFSPVKICNVEDLASRPLVLSAVLDWGYATLESVCLGVNYNPEQYVWDGLRQLPKLSTVVYWPNRSIPGLLSEMEQCLQEALNISSAVNSAALHYVIPANRSLRMEFGFEDAPDHIETLATESRLALHAFIQLPATLPAGSKLASVDLCILEKDRSYTGYSCNCAEYTFWVVMLEPANRMPGQQGSVCAP